MDNVISDISEMTLMFWISTNTTHGMALLSYAVKNSPDEFFVGFKRGQMIITIKSFDISNLDIPPINDRLWHHIAIVIGQTRKKIFFDGKNVWNITLGNHSLPLIRGGGVVAIGQKLECEEAIFDPKMSFVGKISCLNLWQLDVTRDTSCTMQWFNDNCTIGANKPVIQWSDLNNFLSGDISRILLFVCNCKEVQESGINENGEYNLYLTSNLKTPVKIYCSDMDTDKPKEYITLNKETNYAKYYNHMEGHRLEETKFAKIRVHLQNLSVDLNDFKYATSNIHGVFHTYGSAGDCKRPSCGANRLGAFSINLTRTGFILSETIPYTHYSYPECAKRIYNSNMNSTKNIFTGACGGHCGRCTPSEIKLIVA
ncbi:A disintegrin and metalloproteinase with thrombospondin motifs 20-like [Xenia sp. Carnegie-2017]|uniref:A disintegrin and metalloproteinase with thrombospondin motifs 20-like n=1 Tax=Xenia sp. Carnegie-2017 TaxID=2897299 RepID=UPI001F0436DB|nr:A disintegrin and metalloproteinase with thrombospondin motifs 20-like [Xenia sp. Carnegie-2017]